MRLRGINSLRPFSRELDAATRHLAGAIRRWLIVDRITDHFLRVALAECVRVLPQEIVQTLCHVFARAEIRDNGMASSRVGQCDAQGFGSASRSGEDRSPAAAAHPG